MMILVFLVVGFLSPFVIGYYSVERERDRLRRLKNKQCK